MRGVLATLAGTWPRRLAIAALALLPVVVAMVGGFATVPLAPPRQVPPGELVQLGPYDARVESFFVSDRVRVSSLPEGADAWLGVVVELTVTGTAEEYYLPTTIQLPPSQQVLGSGAPDTEILVRDGSMLFRLLPGLPERVALLYAVPDGEAVGDELTLALHSMYSDESFLFEEPSWYEDEAVGTVTVPRDDFLPAVLIDEET